jgi:hypothetical protein
MINEAELSFIEIGSHRHLRLADCRIMTCRNSPNWRLSTAYLWESSLREREALALRTFLPDAYIAVE